DGTVAADCALAMQRAMAPFKEVALDDGGLELASLTLKVSVTAGPVRRYVVGDPKVQLVDVVAGDTVSRLEPLNNLAQPGEVVVDELTAVRLDRLAFGARVVERTVTTSTGAGAFILNPALTHSLLAPALEAARPNGTPGGTRAPAEVRGSAGRSLPSTDQLRAWLLPNVHRRLQAGRGEFLTELRPVAALFMSFDGIDFDADPAAGAKLDALLRWVQAEAERVGGTVVQLTT